jgi:MFS family permease
MVFPFLPWMVRRFKIGGEFVTVEETGYYVGLVATSYFVGRFAGSYFWGVLSDKKGRRPTLILSGVGIAIFTFLFGLTNTTTGLAWAMIMRFFSGAANGIYYV